ncbi:pyrroline-5-carboxylate reductase [Undibacterium sp. Jales W-56]|uniref:pyrroline-5-carboxylate reductase n=1 Tax=Undibacterium sp. Jales W-56 TaxID=2897325 RepID=UPI0021D07CEC|nr:pyrroline-5-carboxylate reductase [Undibacterium sp. Jales W-56]MCU6432410.1 pyrroline-5-carboxylate reductase [Undibacterium sp. Jales W-56]
MQSKLKIAFIGGGNMATALIGGLLPDVTAPEYLHVVDPHQESLDKLVRQFGVAGALQLDASIEQADIIILAVKPQQLRQVAAALAPYLSGQLVLSIAAGIRSVDIARWLNGYNKIVRSMPNTPALIGKGVTGLYATSGVSPEQRSAADHIMQAVGSTVWLEDESLIDAVTAVSGSGPAYVFYFIEAMQQAALELGLPAAQAMQLALATFDGATRLALQSAEPVAVLRDRVTSKGGTTYAALTSMEDHGVKAAIIQAVKAAAARGKELGDEFGAQT